MIRIAAIGCSSIAVALQVVTWTPAATALDLTVRFRGPFGSGADAFWSWLSSPIGRKQQLVVVHSSPGFEAVHASPKLSTARARQAFWTPLDGLIDAARRHFSRAEIR